MLGDSQLDRWEASASHVWFLQESRAWKGLVCLHHPFPGHGTSVPTSFPSQLTAAAMTQIHTEWPVWDPPGAETAQLTV